MITQIDTNFSKEILQQQINVNFKKYFYNQTILNNILINDAQNNF